MTKTIIKVFAEINFSLPNLSRIYVWCHLFYVAPCKICEIQATGYTQESELRVTFGWQH